MQVNIDTIIRVLDDIEGSLKELIGKSPRYTHSHLVSALRDVQDAIAELLLIK